MTELICLCSLLFRYGVFVDDLVLRISYIEKFEENSNFI